MNVPTRPQQAPQAKPIVVKTNSFEIKTLPTITFYHYDVIKKRDPASPDDRSKDKTLPPSQRYMDIISKLEDLNSELLSPRPSYDGGKNMFFCRYIQNTKFTVSMHPRDTSKAIYDIYLKLVGSIDPAVLRNMTTMQGADSTIVRPADTSTVAITLLQVIVAQSPHITNNFSLHSRSFFTNNSSKALSGGLVALQGFFQSVRPVLGRFIINVDTTTAAFYKPGWLVDIAMEFLKLRDVRDVPRSCQNPARTLALRDFLRGLTVVIVSRSTWPNSFERTGENRTVRKKIIRELVLDAGEVSFSINGSMTTVQEYWRNHHNYNLRFPKMFGIKSGDDAVFPAENCWVLPGQRYKRKLSPEDTAQFMKLAVSRPGDRLKSIEHAVRSNVLNYQGSTWMTDAGLRVSTTPLEIRGREIPPPEVRYMDAKLTVGRGTWNVVHQKFFRPVTIEAWAVLNLEYSIMQSPDKLHRLVEKLAFNMRARGMKLPAQPPPELHRNPQNLKEALREACQAAASGLDKNSNPLPLIIVVLPSEAAAIRNMVKYYGDVEFGIATQCIRQGKFDRDMSDRGLDQYCNNVAMKINARMGGVNSDVPALANGPLTDKAMVVGCDVSHPGPGIRGKPSLASMVSSTDRRYARYFGDMSCQNPRQEMIEDIENMLKRAIDRFRAGAGGHFPEKIVIYRDGVSEGEYWQVHEQEISRIDKMLATIPETLPTLSERIPRPKLVFIVVGKRHHVRFFPKDFSQGDSKGNCNPGLVVDSDIVHSQMMDFYLLSHGGLIGTSRPAHYVVLRNDPGWTADELQTMSYGLCTVYAAATRTLSIPAPVFYADRLCARAAMQFEPGNGQPDYSSTTGDDDTFNLEDWTSRLKRSKMGDMYFV